MCNKKTFQITIITVGLGLVTFNVKTPNYIMEVLRLRDFQGYLIFQFLYSTPNLNNFYCIIMYICLD